MTSNGTLLNIPSSLTIGLVKIPPKKCVFLIDSANYTITAFGKRWTPSVVRATYVVKR
jgi:hypothetical protein